jgi:hypothetical protein
MRGNQNSATWNEDTSIRLNVLCADIELLDRCFFEGSVFL